MDGRSESTDHHDVTGNVLFACSTSSWTSVSWCSLSSRSMKRTHSAHIQQRVCHICLNSGDLPQRHTAYDSTAVFMFIVDHKVEQVCKDNWSLWILVCDDVHHTFAWPFRRLRKNPPCFSNNPPGILNRSRVFFLPKNFHLQLLAFRLFSNLSTFSEHGGRRRKARLSYRPHSHGPPVNGTSVGFHQASRWG